MEVCKIFSLSYVFMSLHPHIHKIRKIPNLIVKLYVVENWLIYNSFIHKIIIWLFLYIRHIHNIIYVLNHIKRNLKSHPCKVSKFVPSSMNIGFLFQSIFYISSTPKTLLFKDPTGILFSYPASIHWEEIPKHMIYFQGYILTRDDINKIYFLCPDYI